jgi:hypothetical protein
MKTIGSSSLTLFAFWVRRQSAIESARLITSIAMFYDLEGPVFFVEDVAGLLTGDGIWHFEQSYMPSMLRTNSYDTIRHSSVPIIG